MRSFCCDAVSDSAFKIKVLGGSGSSAKPVGVIGVEMCVVSYLECIST